MISPSYVRTVGLPLIEGRSFDDHDTAPGASVLAALPIRRIDPIEALKLET